MKTLFLAHRTTFPPNKDEKIRASHILGQLAQSYSVSMAYWVDSPDDINHASVLRKFARCCHPYLSKFFHAMLRGIKSLSHGRSFLKDPPRPRLRLLEASA